jgi:hypothetical protein
MLEAVNEAIKIAACDITLRQTYLARETTVDFINKKMPNIDSVDSKFELLRKSIGQITSHGEGLFCEFGVFSGETINYIANQTQEIVYGFDSFEGLPERWRDGYSKGTFKMVKLPRVAKNVSLIKGWFNETLPDFLKKHTGQIIFIHLDCDLYSSAKTVFDLCKGRIKKGTVIVFDEYFNYPGWQDGEYKAFVEFIYENKFEYKYIGYNKYSEQAAVKIL